MMFNNYYLPKNPMRKNKINKKRKKTHNMHRDTTKAKKYPRDCRNYSDLLTGPSCWRKIYSNRAMLCQDWGDPFTSYMAVITNWLTAMGCVCPEWQRTLYPSGAPAFAPVFLGVRQGSRWRAIRAKKSSCGCSLRFVLVPKEKWKSPCNLTKSLC
jgi:hypothetical protein